MAKQPIDVGVKFTGDAAGFQKAAANVKGSATAMKKDIKETAGVFDELGGAIGGMSGELASTVSSIATAATGIGAIVVVVGALAKVWKQSQENIDLYLKSADKLKAGSGGFTVDAETARIDTRKRAQGQISLGYKMEQENLLKLTKFAVLYNEEEKKHFASLVAEGRLMQENGRKLRDSVIGIHDKTEFQRKYTALLKEEEELNDESLAKKTEWAELDAELVKNREIIANKDATEAEKKQAVINAEIIANKLLKDRNGFLDRQIASMTNISVMTATEEVVEQKIADLQKEKNENTEKYYSTLIKVDKMEVKSLKTAEDQLRIAKEFNTHNSEGYKLKNIVASTKGIKALPFRSGKTTDGAPGIQSYGGLNVSEIKAMIEDGEFQSSLEGIQGLVDSLENSFADMFVSISSGSKTAFQDMAKAFGRSLQQIAAQIAAKAAIFGILNLLSGGTGSIGKFASGLLGGKGFGSFMGFANGTNFAPGGLALVGERGPELVNLPRGSQVIPNGMGGNMKIEVVGKVRGRDLALVLTRYQSELMSNT